ncbi:MAG: hypothetical protein BYD32DRAFT_437519 [Podila humilis]|nr:MAG: hypothetical protein BYD32DRAFT_437519 [Podila humilis]
MKSEKSAEGSIYDGAYHASLIRVAYRFAIPNAASGAAQANYCYAHGDDWTDDSHILPVALDLEFNPSVPTCYELGQQSMIQWILEFSNTYKAFLLSTQRGAPKELSKNTQVEWSRLPGHCKWGSHTQSRGLPP